MRKIVIYASRALAWLIVVASIILVIYNLIEMINKMELKTKLLSGYNDGFSFLALHNLEEQVVNHFGGIIMFSVLCMAFVFLALSKMFQNPKYLLMIENIEKIIEHDEKEHSKITLNIKRAEYIDDTETYDTLMDKQDKIVNGLEQLRTKKEELIQLHTLHQYDD